MEKTRVNICDANCKDHLYTNCEEDVVYDYACPEGQYIDEFGNCVIKVECGCYDFTDGNYIAPSESSGEGCKKW